MLQSRNQEYNRYKPEASGTKLDLLSSSSSACLCVVPVASDRRVDCWYVGNGGDSSYRGKSSTTSGSATGTFTGSTEGETVDEFGCAAYRRDGLATRAGRGRVVAVAVAVGPDVNLAARATTSVS